MLSSVLALVGHVHAFIADPLEAGVQRTNTLPLRCDADPPRATTPSEWTGTVRTANLHQENSTNLTVADPFPLARMGTDHTDITLPNRTVALWRPDTQCSKTTLRTADGEAQKESQYMTSAIGEGRGVTPTDILRPSGSGQTHGPHPRTPTPPRHPLTPPSHPTHS